MYYAGRKSEVYVRGGSKIALVELIYGQLGLSLAEEAIQTGFTSSI